MTLDETWFSEACVEHGSAFSLKAKRKLHEEQSDFQKIEVYETETFGNLMVIDGFIMLSDRDNFVYHEMMSHPALFSNDTPREVAIIGGGDCGTLREVLKHPTVEKATQIDIDERVTRVAEQYFPALCESNEDPRADLKFIDGIKWMHERPAASLDVIIIDSTDPIGQAARLFGSEFYGDCLNALRPGGVMVAQSESPLFHAALIKSMRENMLASGFDEVMTLDFPQISYPSGWWSCTLAGKQAKLGEFREQDAREKGFDTDYYTAAIHRGAMAMPAFLERFLAE